MQYSHPYRAESPPPFLAHILFLRHTNADLAHTTTLARVPRVHPSALSPCPPSLSVGSRNPNLKVKFPRGNGRCRALSLSFSLYLSVSVSLSVCLSSARLSYPCTISPSPACPSRDLYPRSCPLLYSRYLCSISLDVPACFDVPSWPIP